MGIGFQVILSKITRKGGIFEYKVSHIEGNTEIIYLHVGGSLLASSSSFVLKTSHLVIDDQVKAI